MSTALYAFSAQGLALALRHAARLCADVYAPQRLAGPGARPEDIAALAPEVLAEERRLLYVGMTRAKSHLCLSFARARTLYGKALAQEPSAFLTQLLADLPAHQLRRTVLAQKVQTRQTHLSLF